MTRITRTLSFIMAAVEVSLFVAVIGEHTLPAGRAYSFFLGRGPIQILSLFVFAYILNVLLMHATRLLKRHRELNSFESRDTSCDPDESIFTAQFGMVMESFQKGGTSFAARTVAGLVENMRRKSDQVYEGFQTLICVLPALGLLGTLQGLSRSLFAAFSSGEIQAESIRVFLTGLAVALDTTVLALVCAMIAGGIVSLLRNVEPRLQERWRTICCERLHLSNLSIGFEQDGNADTNAGGSRLSPDGLYSEIRTLTTEITKTLAKDAAEFIAQSAVSFQETLASIAERIANDHLKLDQTVAESIVDRLCERLDRSLDRMRSQMNDQNGKMAKVFSSRLGQLEGTLRKRIPTELVVRYSSNGNHNSEEEDNAA